MIIEGLCRERCHMLQLRQLGRIATAALKAQVRLCNNHGRVGLTEMMSRMNGTIHATHVGTVSWAAIG